MRRHLLAALALTVGAAPLAGQAARAGIAVMPFDDAGSYGQDKETFQALRLGIPAMLASELARNPAAQVAERGEVQQLVARQDLGDRGRVDAATAARIGRELGARHVVMGSFTDFYGKVRIDARIVDAATGQIVEVVSVGQGERQGLFRMIQTAAQRIMEEIGLPALPAEAAGAAKTRSVPTEALIHYSRALLHHDRGEIDQAVESYRRALQAFPEYVEAREGLRRARPS
ncbi:MAG TPA: CsgG/HfaB family protein [Gemmatimonadales bacterium]|nr:CsgG/HfaB family protein [Gemmatimonadales bacterium]